MVKTILQKLTDRQTDNLIRWFSKYINIVSTLLNDMQYLIDLSIIMSGKYTDFHINQVRYNIVYIKKNIVDKHVCI